ncbi:DNA recombination protein RmuC [Variovorax sp. dw_954]|uniref:DNA recombination protein RmuC n=1 Tax=Variovorax sp. dw_954 TaxID=2720078 RepID=UPI00211650CC|nr:DNA recombination protein RmuC [Variovorax sp. dw_954]
MSDWNAWMVPAALAAVALLVGLLAGWLFGGASARRSAQESLKEQVDEARAQALQMATAEAEGNLRPQIAVAQERARGVEQELGTLHAEFADLRAQSDDWRDALDNVRDERAQLAERAERVPVLEQALMQERHAHDALRNEASALRTQVAELKTQMEADRHEAGQLQALQRAQAEEKLAYLHEAREALANQFKALANDILEEKSKRFVEQNQTSLGALLDPLRMRLADFQGRVEQFYDTEGKQRSALAQQVTQLMELNQLLGAEARNLTQALKGSSKTQGNWGELILERVLEASGLRRGVEYHVQQSHTREDGSRAQPDVIIHLPEDRKLVVDAKVSLLAYEECVSAESDEQRHSAQRRHLASIRTHIDGLSSKRYEQLYSLKSLDFVLMFVPIEPAFMLAVSADDQLFMDAWARNVLLVSPSTLLFVVRTVAHLWRQEQQSRNAQDIAKRGAELYDKLAAFVGDLERVGKSLDQAQAAYGEAFKKFKSGNGNAIRQAEMLRALGVKPTKSFSAATLDAAIPEAGLEASEPGLPLIGLPEDPPQT